jgi:hypothetical protein
MDLRKDKKYQAEEVNKNIGIFTQKNVCIQQRAKCDHKPPKNSMQKLSPHATLSGRRSLEV